MKRKIYADSFAINRINTVIHDIVNRFHADTSTFVLSGYDDAGSIALRYTELAYQHPLDYPLQPKAVFGVDAPVDLFGLWHWAEGQIKKNYWTGAVGDAHYSELVKRLLLLNNNNVEFIVAKQPGMRSNGVRNPTSLSIVDEVECVQWIKHTLGIFDVNTWIPSYTLEIPKGWSTERFSLPASFASGMSFKGVEELRFTPGWGDSTSNDYWSYAYLWWLNREQRVDALIVQNNMEALYTGLVDRNILSRHIPVDKQIATKVSVQKTETSTGDTQTFRGHVNMLDYMTQKPITLNLIVHVKKCSSNIAVIVAVSPKLYSDTVWNKLNAINQSFSCNK
jgi:hypothetical protein